MGLDEAGGELEKDGGFPLGAEVLDIQLHGLADDAGDDGFRRADDGGV